MRDTYLTNGAGQPLDNYELTCEKWREIFKNMDHEAGLLFDKRRSFMKIIFAPDSFKGSLSAERACELLEKEAKKVFPDCRTVSMPVSDGGEGAVDVVIPSLQGKIQQLLVHGPLGDAVTAQYGVFRENCMMIEMASASGLTLVEPEKRDILHANTFGTGELIRHGLDAGCRNFYIAIGGSATNDGGIGCASALGVRFLDEEGNELSPLPENLKKIARIDISKIHPALKESSFTVMCDVTNPLTGPEGATNVFGPQKGGSREELELLEDGMVHYRKVLKEFTGIDVGGVPGAGAAGGLGAGLLAFTGAQMESGIQVILRILGFEELIADADLVITGEGQIDYQSAFGKVPSGVGKACLRHGVPCVVLAGSIGKGAEKLEECGICSMMSILNAPMPLKEAIERAEELFSGAAHRLFMMVKAGMQIGKK